MEYSILFVILLGLGIVFLGLVCIFVLTMLMGKLLDSAKAPTAAIAAAPETDAAAAHTGYTVNDSCVVAAIIAAVTETLGPSAWSMKITNIKKI